MDPPGPSFRRSSRERAQDVEVALQDAALRDGLRTHRVELELFRVDDDVGVRELAQFAQLCRREFRLGRPAASDALSRSERPQGRSACPFARVFTQAKSKSGVGISAASLCMRLRAS